MAITLKGTGGIDTPSINATSNAVFGGTVDFTQAVLKGINKWETVATNSNVFSNRNYFVNTGSGSLTLTLPTSANVGDVIVIQDSAGFASSNNITINRNGNPIDGSNRNAILNIDRGGVALTYESDRNGWVTKKEQENSSFGDFQGDISGYMSGGFTSSDVDTIDKFEFASTANASDIGNLTQARRDAAPQVSSISGYSSGGYFPGMLTTIDKFPFATDTNASDVGDLTQARRAYAGNSSDINGYAVGGTNPNRVDTIDKFPFAVDANATDVGDLVTTKGEAAGQTSKVSGYASGGTGGPDAPGNHTSIMKFPFATDNNASSVGDLTQARNTVTGHSSSIFGYTSGGNIPPQTNTIDKFPFAADANATDVGDLTAALNGGSGQSSVTFAFYSGGGAPNPSPPPISNNVADIEKFPFASDSNSVDAGFDLSQARRFGTAQQV